MIRSFDQGKFDRLDQRVVFLRIWISYLSIFERKSLTDKNMIN